MDNQKHILVIFIIVTVFSFHILMCSAQDNMKAPIKLQSENRFEKYGAGSNSFLNFYQSWISPAKGGNKCPMHPSCSQYAKIAFQVLPWHKAYIKSLERLLRCGNELYLYPTIRINGTKRWYDPLLVKESQHESKTSEDNLPLPANSTEIQFSDEGFADYLFKQGEYYRAITEYYRLIYHATDSTKKAGLFRNIGLCYFMGADYEGYISFWQRNRFYFQSNPKISAELALYLGKSHYFLDNYQKAIAILEGSEVSPNDLFFNETKFLSGICYARVFNWQMAIEKLQLIEQDSHQKICADNLSNSLKKFPGLPQRSPLWAGTLSSIIPGAGYVYCNRKGTGLTSFIVNGLLIWTIREAMIKKQYALATTASFLGIGWYIGNIKGSVDAAKAHNVHVRKEFINSLLEKENLYEYVKN